MILTLHHDVLAMMVRVAFSDPQNTITARYHQIQLDACFLKIFHSSKEVELNNVLMVSKIQDAGNRRNAIRIAMKICCLSLPKAARLCATKKKKPLEVQYFTRGFLRDAARHCE